MSNGPIEPDADKRQAAHELHQMYVALTLEGFTEGQALTIIGKILSAGMGEQ